jgi:NAD(P)-dependent dehydrogenase (short-subunit alcohol dehydrogenase family)
MRTSDAVNAFAPVPQRESAPRFVRRCWHIIGRDTHPVTGELRARSAAPHVCAEDRSGTAVLLGTEFGWEDNARLLDGIAAARRDGGRLVLVHLGAGGGSLLKTAATEDPRLEVLSIELSGTPPAKATRVAATLANSEADRCNDLQVDDAGQITRIMWQPVELPGIPPALTWESNGSPPGSVIVTGGLGGLGLRAAHVLARVYGLHPVLLDVATPASLAAASAAHLARLRASRTGVTVLDVDITDRGRTVAAVSAVDAPPIRAVVHCAGLLRSGPLSGVSTCRLVAAQQAKVSGLHNVLAALDPGALRHLITFGSIIAEEPHPSMGSYALANELLRRATLKTARNLPHCATVAAQWSLWSGAGMAHRAGAVPQARGLGLAPVSLRAGMTALVRLFGWPAGPVTAASLLLYGGR